MDYEVRNNQARHRYELVVDRRVVAIADYQIDGTTVIVPHVTTEPEKRGQGMAAKLLRGMLDDLRGNNQTIQPLCPFAAAYIRDHPEDTDLLAS
ncbi:MAG: N-acetyltransferase [Acidimicrobiia bacterium]|nr:N-acetyltransferase [Acidimicrobiia bacterium]